MIRSKHTLLIGLLLMAVGMAAPAVAQPDSTDEASAKPASPEGTPTTREAPLSQAERIVRLEESISQAEAELKELREELENPEGEYAQAKEEFTNLGRRLKSLEEEAATQPEGTVDLDGLRKARELAKERFDLAIKEHAAIQQKCTLLERKIQQDTEALKRLQTPASQPAAPPASDATPPAEQTGEASPAPAIKSVPPVATVKVPAAPSPAPAPTAPAPAPAAPAPAPAAPAQPAPAAPAPAAPAAPVAPTAPAAPAAAGDLPPSADTASQPMSEELARAHQEAQARKAEAQKAEEELKSVTERIDTLRAQIENQREQLETVRQQARNARERHSLARERAQNLTATGGDSEAVTRAWANADRAERQASEAEVEAAETARRIDDLQSELAELQSEYITALEERERAQEGAKQAYQLLADLENPFALHRILQWLVDHGPRIIGIIVAMAVLLWLTKVFEYRIVKLIALRGDIGTEDEREARAKTLASVFRNVGTTAIIVGGVLMILTEIEIDIVPLLGAAGVVGLAIAFGAQSLIKDYFSGFIILLENQYAINDVIKIGDTSGVVEHISLRMTVLRDLEGNVHFVPHGEVTSVTNMTHGWSRALFDIGVAYKEPIDRVMRVLMELGREIRRDPAFSPLILDDPEMLGVDQFGESAVVIKFFIKTRPLRQWTVKRELLRRIKNRFDELGIEIPFPHRTIYHRHEQDRSSDAEALAPLSGGSDGRS